MYSVHVHVNVSDYLVAQNIHFPELIQHGILLIYRFGIIISNNYYITIYTDRHFLMMWAKITSYAIQSV